MLKRSFIAVISTLAASVVLAQLYKWTDEDGVVHYSDQPTEGAEELQLPAPVDRPAPAPVARRSARKAGDSADKSQAFRYESLAIESPQSEESLWGIAGVLDVVVTAKPAVRPGHSLLVYLDGESRPTNGVSFQIDEVYRGAHTIHAEILDKSGELMIRSEPSQFYVKQRNVIVRPN